MLFREKSEPNATEVSLRRLELSETLYNLEELRSDQRHHWSLSVMSSQAKRGFGERRIIVVSSCIPRLSITSGEKEKVAGFGRVCCDSYKI